MLMFRSESHSHFREGIIHGGSYGGWYVDGGIVIDGGIGIAVALVIGWEVGGAGEFVGCESGDGLVGAVDAVPREGF